MTQAAAQIIKARDREWRRAIMRYCTGPHRGDAAWVSGGNILRRMMVPKNGAKKK